MTNTIRPHVATSLLIQGEVQTGEDIRKPVTLGGQRKSDDRARKVVGDGMHGRSCHVNQGDLPDRRSEFMRRESPKSRSGRSQSVHRSKEAG